jgi:hypothetical protein
MINDYIVNEYRIMNGIFKTLLDTSECLDLSDIHNIDNLEGLKYYIRPLDKTKTQFLLRTELASAYTYISLYYKQCMGSYNLLIIYIPPPKLH